MAPGASGFFLRNGSFHDASAVAKDLSTATEGGGVVKICRTANTQGDSGLVPDVGGQF